MRSAEKPSIAEDVPWSDGITAYDEEHLTTYLRLLDAHADDASADDMARVVLGIDPAQEPQRAHRAVASHLHRARWMVEHGYERLRARH